MPYRTADSGSLASVLYWIHQQSPDLNCSAPLVFEKWMLKQENCVCPNFLPLDTLPLIFANSSF